MSEQQTALWNGVAGHAWVDLQDLLDALMEPLARPVFDAVPAGSALRVLDVGCGTGATTLAVAARLGDGGRVVGIDLSAPMIGAARARAEREGSAVTFVVGDVQTHPFEAAGLDLVVSRFGVMFFDDPVRAFANLRRASVDGGALSFVAWRTEAENPFMTTAERAAAPFVPGIPPRVPGGPGACSFGEEDVVRRILGESGWAGVGLRPLDVECRFPARELGRYVTRLGPLGNALQDADDRRRQEVFEAIRPAFGPFLHGDDIRFVAACWHVTAEAGRQGQSP